MLRQEELSFIKATSTLEPSPARLKDLRETLTPRRKKPVFSAGSSSTTPGGGSKASQWSSSQLASKNKAN